MKYIVFSIGLFLFLFNLNPIVVSGQETTKKEIAPGIHKLSFGTPDTFTPYTFCAEQPRVEAMNNMPEGKLPFLLDDILIMKNDRGCSVVIPLQDNEQLYGFGLQIGSFEQRGLKRRPLVNDYPLNNLGYTHAPQTFYVSTAGYGIIINTARYTTFHCGSNSLKKESAQTEEKNKSIKTNTEDLYRNLAGGSYVFIDIPGADGVELFAIQGNGIKNVVERYNLFSGGGCLPPLWGLGLKYRVKGDFNEKEVLNIADYFRKNEIPCDMLGLEPGWQTSAYSCSYVWSDRFPNHKQMISDLKKNGFQINLWEHAYVNPSSPIYEPLYDYSGNFLVWNGLVPDFTLPEARKIFGDYHKKLLDDGVMGFKLDECDNSDITHGSATWGFPDMSVFPSGIDGEQMHQMFGSLYVKTLDGIFKERNLRTYQDYRSSGLFMSSVPAVLYSDTYDLKEYIRMICNSAFGGLLWSPELRESRSEEELFHRLRTALLAPQTLVNAWYMPNPPWLQYDRGLNNESKFLPNAAEVENTARQLLNMRMSLIPYLYAAFFDYNSKGTPPFRPLIMDYPDDRKTRSIDDQYMMGENIMVAPLYRAGSKRKVYFPEGTWYNFYTHETYQGGQEYEIETPYSQLPLYVKSGSIIPMASPLQHVADNAVFTVDCHVFGENAQPFTLIEDDGVSYNYEKGAYNTIELSVTKNKGKYSRKGNFPEKRYVIQNWTFIP